MKYFSKLAALLLGAAMIFAFAGCANSTDSDDTENVVYTLKNVSDSEMTFSYKNKSNVYVNERIVPANGIYEIPASDAVVIVEYTDDFTGTTGRYPVIYFKVNGTEIVINKEILEEGVCKIKLNIYGRPEIDLYHE